MRHFSLFITTIFFTSFSLSSSQSLEATPPPPPPPAPEPSPPPPPPSFPTPSIALSPPLATANLPLPPLECTLQLITTNYSQPPFTAVYSPPENCSSPWNHAVLQFSGEITGSQSYLVAGVWLSDVEILRTSTPESNDINGTFWNVSKDITRYNSVLQKPNISISLIFENLVNGEFTGNCDFNVSILFYKDATIKKIGGRKLGLGFEDLRGGVGVYDQPADLVIPVVNEGSEGYWFRIERESEVGSRRIEFPENARRIVLELYVSAHGDDELWFSNPPNEYIEMNNLNVRGRNGASRQVLVKIDGGLVGYEVPFPVIYTGGINPYSWGSIVAIGAFDLPSYDVEVTPFLSGLLDGNNHSVEIQVANAGSFWLVDANLHVWLDQNSTKVEAGVVVGKPSEFEESKEFKFKQLDGEFEYEVKRKTESSGWVADSLGNFTTIVSRELEFKNKIRYQQNGAHKSLEQKVKVKTTLKVVSNTSSVISSRSSELEYPLTVVTSTIPGQNDTNSITTNIRLSLKEKSSYGNSKTSLENSQDSSGSLVVKDDSILSGIARTHQTLNYKGPSSCVIRTAVAAGGNLLSDSTAVCSSHIIKELSSW